MPFPRAPLRFVHPRTFDSCDDGCEYTNGSGTMGRACDATCEHGDPFGTLGCNAKDGSYGTLCRTCYYDVDTALAQDTRDNRAIM